MRVDFVKAVETVLARDPRALFITGDLGFNSLEQLVTKYGKRFINAGVAEQSMMGLAAGTALTGFRPWVYSIAPFATFRCLEQIRNDVCLHRLPVRIVGNGGGYTYGIMGSTHHALEDLAVLKVLPNMQLFFPCANDQVAAAVALMSELDDPSYLRLAVSAYFTDLAPLTEHPLTLTRSYAVRAERGKPGVTVIGAGHGVQVALRALAAHGLDRENADVFGVARFPFQLAEDSALMASVLETRNVVFVEEHYAAGGMGESLKFALPPLSAFSLMSARYQLDQRYGSAAFHMKQTALTPEALVALVQAKLRVP
ncbi:MAG TPA: transketolase C-terminal domain-containing protein [Polyangiaceae bacterium]|nr:transketolase C-terminal domain-containing protein [Polyangiaceae bacterium]